MTTILCQKILSKHNQEFYQIFISWATIYDGGLTMISNIDCSYCDCKQYTDLIMTPNFISVPQLIQNIT